MARLSKRGIPNDYIPGAVPNHGLTLK